MRSLFAWLRRQFAPTVPPPPPRVRPPDDTPAPTERFSFPHRCPRCRLRVAEGVRHECPSALWPDHGGES